MDQHLFQIFFIGKHLYKRNIVFNYKNTFISYSFLYNIRFLLLLIINIRFFNSFIN